ncbi:GNAT family N-acetyltransferase [Sphingomonas xinjiangensis]|uniref:Ribosomal protein S18 acetylase RimI-like enzyme n=1 Tax=Sphingomonas xinjiangensis TaxID=643568 RepID=A0A840YPR3_9SPHN|nr:GNAT family N-acetyltransferase [Sphingomonas xinjiangensis]MBB5710351.1 ribosomal protein S18 acetylase RimI-like enzyme [Sphingomonas xinjiangensis]
MPDTHWTVCEAGLADAPALAVIGAASFLDTFAGVLSGSAIVEHCLGANSAERYAQYLSDGGRAWLAKIAPGAAPIGFALLTKPQIEGAQDGDIELKRIYTLSRFHGTGVGAALMQAVVAGAQGHARLLLGVYGANERAIAFYRKNGFDQIATRKFDIGGTLYDDVVLARPLAA